MGWDIAIAVLGGLFQLAITWYAVDVSMRDNRLKNALIIGTVGLLGIAMTVIGTIRNGLAQSDLERQLKTIQHNTEADKHGQIQFLNPMEITDNPIVPIHANEIPYFNIYFQNIGNMSITDGNLDATVVIVPLDQIDSKTVFQYYKDRIDQHVFGGTLVHNQIGYHTFSGSPVTEDDVFKLNSAQEAFCTIGTMHWKDETGSYDTETGLCYVAEKNGQFAWHDLVENNRESRTK